MGSPEARPAIHVPNPNGDGTGVLFTRVVIMHKRWKDPPRDERYLCWKNTITVDGQTFAGNEQCRPLDGCPESIAGLVSKLPAVDEDDLPPPVLTAIDGTPIDLSLDLRRTDG